ncbi:MULTISPECIES: LPD38 domain-containing protein [Flavobacterium]|uniref:Large polyvalent protein associated domain-containing protein n=1 Tax=Flavobacterium keumense TaxID=1306518 RepID=A0ABY8N3R4_9FLAO|nr:MULTISPECIES: LPD38 domain-containing protein [Flavobacterium]WGK93783.1 hypothetical protein MG292_06680 [Flavobacterium keumense]
MLKKLNENAMKMAESGSSKEDIIAMKDAFIEKFGTQDTVKKKDDSVSTSQKENGDLAPGNGSLGTNENNGMATLKKGYDLNISSNEPKYSEKKPVKILQLKNKLLNTKVTPENMDEINAATNEISALQKKQTQNAIAIKKQEDLQKDPNFLSKYQDFMSKTSTVTDDDVLRAKDELNSEIDNNEWTDVLREGAKKAVNNVVDFANTPMKFINSLGGDLPTIPLIEAKKPLEKNLKQADEYFLRLKKDAIKNNKSIPKVTQEDRLEKAKEFFIKEKTDSYLASRQKDYLQEQDDIDGGVLQSKFADFEKGKLASIDEKEKILLNKQAVQEVTHTRLQTEIENLQEQAKKIGVTDELKQSFNEKVALLKQVESEGLQTINEYVNNRNNIGNVTDNLDIFKRNYSLWGNLSGNIAVASTDLISGAFGALDYGAKAISKATGLKSGGLFEDASKDTKMLSEKIASEIEKPISVENINSLSDFGDWLMNDVGAKQIPILALISTGTAGIAGIGATALGSKFEDMRGEVQRGEKKYSTTEMLLHPLGYGLAETASAAVDLMVLKNAGRVISSATDLERREIAKGMWNRAKNYLGASIEGGVTETLDETGTQGIENIIDGKPFTEGMIDAGAAGGAMGFIIPFIAANYKQTIKPFTTDNKIQEASAKALKLQAQLDNPKLDSDTKLIIQENLDKAKTEVESLIKKSVKDISVLSNDQFKEIVSIEKTQAEIKSKAEKIKFDDNLEDDLKNQIIANLKTEFDTTEQRRIDLLQRGASAEIGRLAPEEQIRLKDLAQRKLMKELNPDGTKNISLNDEQISKEAVAIFKEEKVVNNENNPKFVSDEQQTKISNSGTPEELGSGNEIYSREQEALNRLGERTRADEEKLQRPLTRFEIEDLQKEEALKFAKEKDLWVKDFYSLGTPTNIGGNENTIVYNKKEQTLYKSNNLSNHQNTLSSFFEGLEGHNSIFPETQYELVGFTGIDKGKDKTPYIEPILKQDFVLNADQATQEDIDNHMASIGFEKVNDHTFKNEQYTVSDLRPRNVLKDANGTIYVIDDIVKKNKPNEAEASQNIPDKSNIQTKTITSSKVKNPKTGESTAFDVDIENGIVTGIRNSKTGKPIEEFVEATYKSKDKKTGKIITKTKLRKNGNWASIESEALGLETENEVNKKNKEILTNFTPSNEYEAALHALATGSKISYESLSSEAGNTDSKWATNQSAKETLPSVEKLSEQIWQSSETELDQQEIRNQLIDIINSFGSTKEVQQAVINIGNENKIKLQEEEMRVFLGSLTEKEFAQYEAIKAEDDYISELTDEEAMAYFEKEYESKTEEYYEKRGQSKTNEPSGTIESNSVQERSGEKETTRGKERQGEEINTEQASTQDRKSTLITERIKPEKKQSKNTPKKLPQIIKDAAKGLKATLIYGKSSRARSLGTYNSTNALTRITRAGDIDTVSHELGHFIDDKFNLLGTIPSTDIAATKNELRWFYDRGGSNPPSRLSSDRKKIYLEREGLAEFTRAYIVNSNQAKLMAPKLFEHFENTVPKDALAVIKQLSDDYLDYSNASYGEQIIANIEDSDLPDKNGFKEWLNSFKKEDGQFSLTPFDRLNSHMFNSMVNAEKAFRFVLDKADIKNISPKNNFEILHRVFAGINGKTNAILSNGLTDGKNNVLKDKNGNPMTIDWLLEGLDSTSEKTIKEDMDDVIKLLVAERTIEYANKFGRLDNLTGIGAGVNSDIDVAQGFLNDFESLKQTNKEKYSRIKEASKRYRDYADAGLKYAVDKGRISKESYETIKQNNQYYVSLARVNENAPMEEEVPIFNEMAGGIASVKDIIKKAKGGTKFIQNPYLSLLQNTVNIIKESDRNEVLRSFVEPMINLREMGDGTPIDFSQIARPSKAGDKNSKTIYINGEAQKWQFSQDVFDSLTSLESLSDNTLAWSLVWWLSIPANIIRFTVTNFPVFALRNSVRDTQSRLIVSRTNGTFKDLIHNAEDKELFEIYGGSQAGYYLINKNSYKEKLRSTVKEITANGGLVLDPRNLRTNYKKALEKGENLNRIAEFKSAYKKAKKEGLDDYDAGLYAAYQARDLMDFAVAGHTIRTLNKFIPFLNAGIQGLVRTKKSATEDPSGFMYRTAIYTVLPTIAFRLFVSAMGDDDEYEELPAYQRDLFYNFKLPNSNYWISIPKSFEQGIISAGVDRSISKYKGYDTAFEGFGGTLSKLLIPVEESQILGGLKPIFEVSTNYNMFTDRPIIPQFEAGKMIELRKGAKDASRLGIAIQEGLKKGGLEVDPRNVDHIIKSYGTYFGDLALSISDLGREDSKYKFDIKKTGFARDIPISNSVSVNSVYKLTAELGKWQDKRVKILRAKIENFYNEDDTAKRKEISKDIYLYARELRKNLEAEKQIQKEKATSN